MAWETGSDQRLFRPAGSRQSHNGTTPCARSGSPECGNWGSVPVMSTGEPYQPDDYRRIEQAIHYIRRHMTAQPDLAEIAAHVGLSPFHFQRMFRRWAGVSPKRFLEYLTVDQAKRLLAQSESVLAASDAVGLSSPARLHDHFVSIEAVTPGDFKRQGLGLGIRYGFSPSPFGEALVARTARGICALSFVEPGAGDAALEALRRAWPAAEFRRDDAGAATTLARVFSARGDRGDRIRLAIRGTNFQVKVWNALLRIPTGAVTTYSHIARSIDAPLAARSVGTAIGANPVAVLIPCHRVIRSDGGLGGYRWGEPRKAAIIGWEQAVTVQEDD